MEYDDLIRALQSDEVRESNLLDLIEKRIEVVKKKMAQKNIMVDKNEDSVAKINKIVKILCDYGFIMKEQKREKARFVLRNVLETVIALGLGSVLLWKVSLHLGLNLRILIGLFGLIGSLGGVKRLFKDREIRNVVEEINKLKFIKAEYDNGSVQIIREMLKQERMGLEKVLDYLQTLLDKLVGEKENIQKNLEQINQKMNDIIQQAEMNTKIGESLESLENDCGNNPVMRRLEV